MEQPVEQLLRLFHLFRPDFGDSGGCSRGCSTLCDALEGRLFFLLSGVDSLLSVGPDSFAAASAGGLFPAVDFLHDGGYRVGVLRFKVCKIPVEAFDPDFGIGDCLPSVHFGIGSVGAVGSGGYEFTASAV